MTGGLRVLVSLRKIAAMLAVAAVAGYCSPAPARAAELAPASGAAQGTSYWTVSHLLAARAWQAGGTTASPNARTARKAPRVGALFLRESSGNHFCTASVVSSPGRDLLITAAHCINGGNGSGYRSDIVFVPGYRDGTDPYGIWTPARLLVAPGWARSADPDLDVGFVALNPRHGENIEQVLGANTVTFNTGYRNLVRVTGYPTSSPSPITCRNWTSRLSATQLKFSCDGFTGGTSGSPWVTDFNLVTRTGHIVGVLGGYEQGGRTSGVSYSPYLGAAIKHLYAEAMAG
jgi:V8-like Glu-specific endopeptidase